MNSEFYSVYVENDKVATEMPLAIALILVKALYAEYYAEPSLRIGIERFQYDTETEKEITFVEDVDE